MKPVGFDYERAQSAAAALAGGADEASRYLAGGQTLGPMLNLRLARPDRLIDVSRLDELRRSEARERSVFIGAAVTHAEIEDGETPDPLHGHMQAVAGGIAYRVVRNKGTIGGSLAHADPAADWPTFLTAAGARVHLHGAAGERALALEDFVLAAYTTALAPGELVVAVEVPRRSKALRVGYYKLCRKVGEFADAIGAVVVDPEQAWCRVVCGAVAPRPVILTETAASLARNAAAPGVESVEAEIEALAGPGDAVKRRMGAVAVVRAVQRALGEAVGR